MNARTARELLRCCPPGSEDDDERGMRAARRVAAKTPGMEETFRNQLAFDRVAAAQLEVVVPPDVAVELAGYAEKFGTHKRGARLSFRDPAMMAVAASFLVLVGLLAWLFLARSTGFTGMREVAELARLGDGAGVEQFDPLAAKAGTLGDWFILEGFEGFKVPEGFEEFDVVGVRTFVYEGETVASAAVPIKERRGFFYVFDPHALGVVLPEDGSWRLLEYDEVGGRALAARLVGNKAFLVTMDGTERDLAGLVRPPADG